MPLKRGAFLFMPKLNNEQLSVVKSESKLVQVIAPAGSGKTTTLYMFASNRVDKKILYLVFNKAMVKSNKLSNLQNVDVTTIHSLAYRSVGRQYDKRGRLAKVVKLGQVLDALYLPSNRKTYFIATKILKIIQDFCHSSECKFNSFVDNYSKEDIGVTIQEIKQYAKIVWSFMLDRNGKFPITHDVYLKIFEMDSPSLDYDYILFDEAQDGNPAVSNIISKQLSRTDRDIKLVLVGDKNQAIYGFRGAVNFFDILKPTERLFLSNSYRFGQKIASYLNALLVTTDKSDGLIVGCREKDAIAPVEGLDNYALIARNNATIFNRAIKYAYQGKRLYFVDGVDSYGFDILLDLENLRAGKRKKIISHLVSSYSSFDDFEKSFRDQGDKNMINLCNIVKSKKEKIRDYVTAIKNAVVISPEDANVCLMTAHKSKGLEFDNVELTNDFYSPIDEAGTLKRNINNEEVNILYVAASRAKLRLLPNRALSDVYTYATERGKVLNREPKVDAVEGSDASNSESCVVEEEFIVDKLNSNDIDNIQLGGNDFG